LKEGGVGKRRLKQREDRKKQKEGISDLGEKKEAPTPPFSPVARKP